VNDVLSFTDGRLRPARREDTTALRAFLHQPDVRRFLCDDEKVSTEFVEDLLTQSRDGEQRGLGLWVVDHDKQAFAGLIGLQGLDQSSEKAPQAADAIEVIVAVGPRWTGRGLASTALKAVLRHARNRWGFARVLARVDEPNEASHRLFERLGFTRGDTVAGPIYPLVTYELSLETADV